MRVMRFAILGPLEVSASAGPIALGGHKQRALLALLLLQANTVVSRDRLMDVLWGECPPPSAAQSLDAYLSRLRKLVGHDRLVRSAGGYVLRVEPGELDADRFERLVATGRHAADGGDAATAVHDFAAALALWRGPPLGEFAFEPFARVRSRGWRRRGSRRSRITSTPSSAWVAGQSWYPNSSSSSRSIRYVSGCWQR